MKHNHKKGFTLIELLTVTAIISILAGMIGIAAHAARQRAYATQARLEAQQVATAFRAYWVAEGKWPTQFLPDSSGPITWTQLKVSDLMGHGGKGIVRSPFLEISEEDFAGSDDYLDPWGHPYQLTIDPLQDVTQPDQFQVVVGFLNAEKHYYQE